MSGIQSFPVASQKMFVQYFVSGNLLVSGPSMWVKYDLAITTAQYIYAYSHSSILCFVLSIHSQKFPILLEYVFKYLAFQFRNNPSGLRPAAGGARSANGFAPSYVPGRWHSSTTGGARATNESFEDGGLSWHWQTLMVWMFGFFAWGNGGKGLLYGILKETFIGVYMYIVYILYNKAPFTCKELIFMIHGGCDRRRTCEPVSFWIERVKNHLGENPYTSWLHVFSILIGYTFPR